MQPYELAGVVQLDRGGEPPRVMLDTTPPTRLSVEWRDIVGCWLVRIYVDHGDRRHQVELELLVVQWRGPFIRIPGQDAYWPTCERYGVGIESVAAVADRDQRRGGQQRQISFAALAHERGNIGTKIRTRKKGRR